MTQNNKPLVVSKKQLTLPNESQNLSIGAWIRNEEEKEIYASQFSKQLKEFKSNEDKINLIKAITSWRLHLGIRETMSDEELLINMGFLKDAYPNISLDDIRLAVRFSLNGRLGINAETFGSFSPLYISKIINSYLDFKQQSIIAIKVHKKYLEKMNDKPVVITYEEQVKEKRKFIIWFANKLKTNSNYIADFESFVWRFLNRKNLINHDTIDWEDANEKTEILTNKNVYSVFEKYMRNLNPNQKEEEKTRLKEIYGRYYVMQNFFKKVIDIDVWIEQFSDEDILPLKQNK